MLINVGGTGSELERSYSVRGFNTEILNRSFLGVRVGISAPVGFGDDIYRTAFHRQVFQQNGCGDLAGGFVGVRSADNQDAWTRFGTFDNIDVAIADGAF